jgi:hypothetical protein
MYVWTSGSRRLRRRAVTGSGLLDWLSGVTSSIPRAVGSAAAFLSANKDTISNAANVINSVAKACAKTASAVKQIVDVVKAKRAAAQRVKSPTTLPKPLEKVLSQKSIDFLQQLARSESAGNPEGQQNINASIAGASFKTLNPR